uniref:Sacsin/Nov domain-containing protein n=1 Tax=Arcella intermedia TaxID=1963864 RepID=A0A6B2LS16_9EUKA
MVDPDKIGRFGLGFCSIFHITDVPSFISGTQISFFDPHETNLPNKKRGVKGNFVRDNLGAKYPRQFESYNIFGFNEKKEYPSTLFRFPLRSKPSTISQRVYTNELISKLFEDLVV